MLTERNAKAYAVLAIIHDIIADDLRAKLDVQFYHNGREEGFAVRGQGKVAVFSQDRQSDAIVVYTGKEVDFGFHNAPTDSCYRKAVRYGHANYYEAASFILDQLFG